MASLGLSRDLEKQRLHSQGGESAGTSQNLPWKWHPHTLHGGGTHPDEFQGRESMVAPRRVHPVGQRRQETGTHPGNGTPT